MRVASAATISPPRMPHFFTLLLLLQDKRAASSKRAPWPIAALAPNALPNGVLVHRSSRLAPPVCVFTLAPPVPSQVLTVSRLEGRLIPLVVYETHREDRVAGVCVAPPPRTVVRTSNGPTARTHATAPPAT